MQALGQGGPHKLLFELEPIWFIEQLLLHVPLFKGQLLWADLKSNFQDNSQSSARQEPFCAIAQHVGAYLPPCFRFASSSNDAGCAWLDGHSASDLLRKASGCNFLVANPTNQLFTAFHRDVISYNPTACHASFVALKGRNNVRFALARLIWSVNTARQGRWWG